MSNGVAPKVWEIKVLPSKIFMDDKKQLEIPNTSRVEVNKIKSK